MTRLLTPPEAAERLARPERTLAQWRYQGRGPRYVKVEGAVRYPQDALNDYIASHTVDPAAGDAA